MADDDRPANLETKDTRNTLIGYNPSTVPNIDRVGTELTDEERTRGDAVTGSPAQGNGIQNSALVGVGETGVTTGSGGTQSAPTETGSQGRAGRSTKS